MNWKKLLQNGSLQKKKFSFKEVTKVLTKAQEAVKAAEILNKQNLEDSAFEQAYKAMLLAGRALIFSFGLRPKSAGSHIITIKFCKKFLDKDYVLLIKRFEKARKKRNYLIYGTSRTVSKTETENLIKTAKVFIAKIEKFIQAKNPQSKLL